MILLLAAQLLQPEALPPAMEPALNEYGGCIFASIGAALQEKHGTKLKRRIDAAFDSCQKVREASVAKAEAALSHDPRFTNVSYRKVFVANRFDGLDAMARETADGAFDPDNWK